MQVPYFRPDIDERDIRSVTDVLRSGWLTTGPVARQFEREFSEAVGAEHAVAVSSCTNGLHAALVAAGIGPGDEVITTPMTFCGTIRAIEEAGATPVFIDIAHNLNLDCRLLESAVSEKTKAILPVHIAGLPCDLSAIEACARRHRLPVIEDAAHAFGAAWQSRPVGSSDFSTAVFSFYANKNLTTGEGGMITTSNGEHAARLRRVVAFGLQRTSEQSDNRWQYEVVGRGFKYNLSDLLAALGVAQLKKAADHGRRRAEVVEYYADTLSDVDEMELPRKEENSLHAWHLYIIRLHLDRINVSRDEFIQLLAERGVAASVHFRPIPMHSWFAHYGSMESWPITAWEFPRLISLPIYPGLSEAEREFVTQQVRAVFESCRKRPFSLSTAL